MKPFWMAVWALTLAVISLQGAEPKKTGRNEILDNEAWFREYDRYAPDGELLESLKRKISGASRIVVYFGFWCADSENHVPKFLKILDNLPAPGLETDYFSVERKADKNQKYYVEELKIERIPTFIFYRNRRELGRIVENPKTEMLEDILTILF